MKNERLYDVIVIGGGPAGLTAALYLARACYRVLVLEKESFGGQITITSEIVNYPGIEKTSGRELTENIRKQAESFGAEFMLAEATGIDASGDVKTVRTSAGDFQCFGVLLSTGAHPRPVGFPGEAEFKGRGVAYCATCDGEFFTGKEVFVVGGGFAAAEESVFLTRYAKHVTILIRGDGFTCAKATAEAALNHPSITVLTNTEVVEAVGGGALESIKYRNTKTGEETVFAPENDTFGIFVFAGYSPETELVKDLAKLDSRGYVITDGNQKTSADGVYAAGDVCVKNLRQVVTATGDGAVAATELEKYAAKMQKKTGLVPERPAQEAASKDDTKDTTGQTSSAAQKESALFSPEILSQLSSVFSKMESPLILSLKLDEGPVSAELKGYMEELSAHTDKLSVEISYPEGGEDGALPYVEVLKADGSETGLAFHGVPGGHEFTSFVLGLYNAAGPGQPLDDGARAEIAKLAESGKNIRMQILVSLSCTMCPELVTSAQHIAALNPNVTADVYDINHFPNLREKYNVMSVPCLVINGGNVSFGKKNVPQLLEILKEA